MKEDALAREYEDALQWLVDARLVHKVYCADVGLLRRLTKLSPIAFGESNRLFTEFRGP